MHQIFKNRIKLIKAMISANIDLNFLFKPDGEGRYPDELFDMRNNISKIILSIRENKYNHFLSFDSCFPAKVSFSKNIKDKYSYPNRVQTTLGRYIRRQLRISPTKISDTLLDNFCKSVFQYLVDIDELDKRIKILNGKDIEDFYRTTTSTSCMTGAKSKSVRLYCMNPDCVSLVVLDNYVRALLWTCPDGTKILDRIYPSGCGSVNILTEWAKKKGYVRRCRTDFLGDFRFHEQLSDSSSRIFKLKYDDSFPYMDTFKFLSKPNKRWNTVLVSNNKDALPNYLCCAVETHGGLPWEEPKCKCIDCGDRINIDSDYIFYVNEDPVCVNCYEQFYFCCDYCEGNYDNDISISVNGERIICKYCLEEHFAYCCKCNYCGEKEQEIFLYDYNYYCNECLNYYCDECLPKNK